MSLSLSQIQAFPKAELHRHIDGSVPMHAIRQRLLQKDMNEVRLRTGRTISVTDENSFSEEYRIDNKQSIDDLLAVFDLVLSLMQDPEGIEAMTYEVVRELARENILYAELTCAPAYHTRGGLSYDEVFDSLLKGMQRGQEDTGVVTRLIAGIQREAHAREKAEDKRDPYGMKLTKTALRYNAQHPEVAALGLVCDEFSHAPEIYKEAFAMTFGTSLGRVPHAGEMGSPTNRERNVWTVLKELNPRRIGHGIPVSTSDDLINECKRLGVGIECNPWSNILAGFINSAEELHIDRLHQKKVCFSINSDDPALFQKSLSDNIALVCDTYNWGEEELVVMTRNALHLAFLHVDEYKTLCEEFSRKAGMKIV